MASDADIAEKGHLWMGTAQPSTCLELAIGVIMERCPKCYTHPKLMQSGWSIKTLLCPVCRERFYSAAEVREKKKRVEKEKDVPSWWPLWRQGWYQK